MNQHTKNSLRTRMIWNAAPLVIIAALALVSFSARAQKREPSGLSEDKGKFIISVNGQPVGTEDFSITRAGGDWVAHGTTEIHTGDATSHVTGDLRLNSAVQPLRYVWSTDSGKKITSTTVFDGMNAKIALDLRDGNPPFQQDFKFSAPVIVLDNNLYHQYEILARAYNWKSGGSQTFAVFIPQEQAPGAITAESGAPVTLDGAKFEQLTVRTPDLEVTLYLDSAHRLMRLVVPAAKAEIRRQ
jgi:hypothetical protein